MLVERYKFGYPLQNEHDKQVICNCIARKCMYLNDQVGLLDRHGKLNMTPPGRKGFVTDLFEC